MTQRNILNSKKVTSLTANSFSHNFTKRLLLFLINHQSEILCFNKITTSCTDIKRKVQLKRTMVLGWCKCVPLFKRLSHTFVIFKQTWHFYFCTNNKSLRYNVFGSLNVIMYFTSLRSPPRSQQLIRFLS